MARETTIRGDGSSDHDDDVNKDEQYSSFESEGFEPTESDDELRPSKLEDVIGQAAVVERIRILLQAAKKMRPVPKGGGSEKTASQELRLKDPSARM